MRSQQGMSKERTQGLANSSCKVEETITYLATPEAPNPEGKQCGLAPENPLEGLDPPPGSHHTLSYRKWSHSAASILVRRDYFQLSVSRYDLR
jgi:hypothetical protein